MNTTDSHPRVLSLSTPSTSPSTPSSATTPQTQSRRPSHDADHFVASQEKTHRTLNGSIKKMWRDIKHHAAEHHRSVNAAYQAQYGAGIRTPTLEGYGVPGVEARRAEGRMGSVV